MKKDTDLIKDLEKLGIKGERKESNLDPQSPGGDDKKFKTPDNSPKKQTTPGAPARKRKQDSGALVIPTPNDLGSPEFPRALEGNPQQGNNIPNLRPRNTRATGRNVRPRLS